WGSIARSVHRSGPVASLTAKSLNVGSASGRADAIYLEGGQSELDGQLLFDLGAAARGHDTLGALLEEAESAGEGGRPDEAAALPVFNLARLECDAGKLAEARRLWVRYLELDPDSEWAGVAARGVQFVDMQLARTAG